jgi:hypothetical protein
MPLSVLELGQFELVSLADCLSVSVSSFAHFLLPTSVSILDANAFAEALRSREVWVVRGKSCHAEIRIRVDGKYLEDNQQDHILESLGCHLRDAPVSLQASTK